jgi:hypothetical protein
MPSVREEVSASTGCLDAHADHRHHPLGGARRCPEQIARGRRRLRTRRRRHDDATTGWGAPHRLACALPPGPALVEGCPRRESMVDFIVFIEGGGSIADEQVDMREGFAALFAKLKLTRKPKILCAGARSLAYRDFVNAAARDPEALCLLLVDSEYPITSNMSPWAHIASRVGNGWHQPEGLTDDHLHFMVETMEAWLAPLTAPARAPPRTASASPASPSPAPCCPASASRSLPGTTARPSPSRDSPP